MQQRAAYHRAPRAQPIVAFTVMAAQGVEPPWLLTSMRLRGEEWASHRVWDHILALLFTDCEVLGESCYFFLFQCPFHWLSPSFSHTSLTGENQEMADSFPGSPPSACPTAM